MPDSDIASVRTESNTLACRSKQNSHRNTQNRRRTQSKPERTSLKQTEQMDVLLEELEAKQRECRDAMIMIEVSCSASAIWGGTVGIGCKGRGTGLLGCTVTQAFDV